MELYYAIVNIVDYLAKNGNDSKLYETLDTLLAMTDHTIEDIADANDCGGCSTWNELVDGIRELFETGERS